MNSTYRINSAISNLQSQGIQFAPGLDHAEIAAIEQALSISLPDDVRYFWQTAIPISAGFPDWRRELPRIKSSIIDRQSQDFLFYVETADFWLSDWGVRPSSSRAAIELANSHLAQAPILIPIHKSQVAICIAPRLSTCTDGPVFSVRQSDVSHCARDLASFLEWFAADIDLPQAFHEDYPVVPFWTEAARLNAPCLERPYWPSVISLTYPEYDDVRDAVTHLGGVAEIFRPDGKYGVSIRASGRDKIIAWLIHRNDQFKLRVLGESPRDIFIATSEKVRQVVSLLLSIFQHCHSHEDARKLFDSKIPENEVT